MGKQKGITLTETIIIIGLVIGLVIGVFYFFSKIGSSDEAINTKEASNTASSAIPTIVQTLCQNEKNINFITEDGYHADFRGTALSAQKCENGLWKVDEGPIPESGTFYFDAESNYVDICQLLYRKHVCKKYENLSCDTKNYCL